MAQHDPFFGSKFIGMIEVVLLDLFVCDIDASADLPLDHLGLDELFPNLIPVFVVVQVVLLQGLLKLVFRDVGPRQDLVDGTVDFRFRGIDPCLLGKAFDEALVDQVFQDPSLERRSIPVGHPFLRVLPHLMLIHVNSLLQLALQDRFVVDRGHDPIEHLGGSRQAHKEQQGEEKADEDRPFTGLFLSRLQVFTKGGWDWGVPILSHGLPHS